MADAPQTEIDQDDVELPGIGMRQFLAGLLVLVLVGGSFLLTNEPDLEPYDGASEYIDQLYQDGGEAMANAWDPRSFDQVGLAREQAPLVLDQLLSGGGRAESEGLIEIAGVPIIQVNTDDGFRWCVRPDGVVLPLCQIGSFEITVDASGVGGATTEVLAQSLSILPDVGVNATVVVESFGDELVTATGEPTLEGNTANWNLTSIDAIVQRQFAQLEPGTWQFGQGYGIGLQFTGQLTPEGFLPPARFDLVLGDRTIGISISGPDYWLD